MNEIHERSIKESDFATVLCDDLVLEGKLHCAQPVLLNCRFEGTLIGEDKVVVYRDAVFIGTIHAQSIRVAGQVEGDLYATDLVELESSGGVYGNITAPSIVMENGSVFEGQSHVLRKDKHPRLRKISSKASTPPASPKEIGTDSPPDSASAEHAAVKQVADAGKDSVSEETPPPPKEKKHKLAAVKRS